MITFNREAKMKRSFKLLTVLFAMVFLLNACANRMVKLPTDNPKHKTVPAWYLNHEDNGKEGLIFRHGYFYAVAVAVSPDMEMSMKKAVLKAKAKITDRINGEMNNRTSIVYEEKGAAENVQGIEQSEDVIVNFISKTVLRTYSIEKKLTLYSKDNNNYRSFVLVKISQKDVNEIIALVESKKAMKLSSSISKISDKVLNQSEKQ
tara:strand:- start:303 stop:917 length:615 start_codon:yes stop_codon:yes gene_type:complete